MGKIAPAVLYPRRLAWRALRMVLEQVGLGEMTLRFNPDDPTQVLPGAAVGEMSFYEDFQRGRGQVIATVLLSEHDTRARVLVERVDRLVRRNHLATFRARELGIEQRPGAYDLDVNLDLVELIEVEGAAMRSAPQRVPLPASGPRRPPLAIRAFGGGR